MPWEPTTVSSLPTIRSIGRAPGAEGGPGRDRRRQRIEQHAHGRVLDREQAERLVAGLRPRRATLDQVLLGIRDLPLEIWQSIILSGSEYAGGIKTTSRPKA
jgi:hypothetical protein